MDNKQHQNKDNGEQKKHFNKRNFRHYHKRGKKTNQKENTEAKMAQQATEAIEDPSLMDKDVEFTIASEVQTVSEEATALPTNEEQKKQEQKKKEQELPLLETVGIRFRPVGKNYSFDPNGMQFSMGEQVIVETSQGKEFGTVSTPNRIAAIKPEHLPLKKVLRRANQQDIQKNEENRELERQARKVFHEKNEEHQLEMALSDVECAFDRSKLIFYFTSEGRVDFREFVKDMASVFKTRIELRQIGVRDEAKQLGGLGICGRPLCCSSFLDDFQQVSIKMAKEQNLSLNPTKISGTCGRLMCCLRYENDVYVEASKKCPKVDCPVATPKGNGVVIENNILCGKCKVKLDSDPESIEVFQADELKALPKQKKAAQDSGENRKNENLAEKK